MNNETMRVSNSVIVGGVPRSSCRPSRHGRAFILTLKRLDIEPCRGWASGGKLTAHWLIGRLGYHAIENS